MQQPLAKEKKKGQHQIAIYRHTSEENTSSDLKLKLEHSTGKKKSQQAILLNA